MNEEYASVPTRESSTSSIVISQPTTTSSSTVYASIPTTMSTTTSTTIIDNCARLGGSLNKSACYLSKALSDNDRTICYKIDHKVSRELCLERVGVDAELSSRVYGTVNKRSPAQPLKSITVWVSSLGGETKFSGKTIGGGRYSVEVYGGDTYNVSLSANGKSYSSIVAAKRNWEHQVDFIVA